MAASTTELTTSFFMEEVQKYPFIYYKNKFIRMNICWKVIGENFSLDVAEAKKKKKNSRIIASGRYLKKRKSVPSGSGRENKQIASHKVHSPIDICHFVCESNTKIPLSDPGTL